MTLTLFFHFLLAIVAVEAITEIVTKSEVFSPIREFFFNRRKSKIFDWIHSLFDCGYCTSVWAGVFISILWFCVDSMFLDMIYIGLVLHRLSNMLHFMIDRLNKDRTRDVSSKDL